MDDIFSIKEEHPQLLQVLLHLGEIKFILFFLARMKQTSNHEILDTIELTYRKLWDSGY